MKTAHEALQKLAARAEEHHEARPLDFVRYELAFDSSNPRGDQWSAEFASSQTHEGWEYVSNGFGSTPLEAVEQCLEAE